MKVLAKRSLGILLAILLVIPTPLNAFAQDVNVWQTQGAKEVVTDDEVGITEDASEEDVRKASEAVSAEEVSETSEDASAEAVSEASEAVSAEAASEAGEDVSEEDVSEASEDASEEAASETTELASEATADASEEAVSETTENASEEVPEESSDDMIIEELLSKESRDAKMIYDEATIVTIDGIDYPLDANTEFPEGISVLFETVLKLENFRGRTIYANGTLRMAFSGDNVLDNSAIANRQTIDLADDRTIDPAIYAKGDIFLVSIGNTESNLTIKNASMQEEAIGVYAEGDISFATSQAAGFQTSIYIESACHEKSNQQQPTAIGIYASNTEIEFTEVKVKTDGVNECCIGNGNLILKGDTSDVFEYESTNGKGDANPKGSEFMILFTGAQALKLVNTTGFIQTDFADSNNRVIYTVPGNTKLFCTKTENIVSQIDFTDIGISRPVYFDTPLRVIKHETYTAYISWDGNPEIFKDAKNYKAYIGILPNPGYTLPESYDDYYAQLPTKSSIYASSLSESSGTITVSFYYPTEQPGSVELTDTEINMPFPTVGKRPVTKLTNSNQYTALLTWEGALDANGCFAVGTVYSVSIVIVPKLGYTYKDIAANAFTIRGLTEEMYTSYSSNPGGENYVNVSFVALSGERTINIGGISYERKQDTEFPSGITYDATYDRLILEDYQGTYIGSTLAGEDLNLYLKGDNSFNNFTSAITNRNVNTAIFANYGDITINGDSDATLSITAVSDTNDSAIELHEIDTEGDIFISDICLRIQTFDYEEMTIGIYGENIYLSESDGNVTCYDDGDVIGILAREKLEFNKCKTWIIDVSSANREEATGISCNSKQAAGGGCILDAEMLYVISTQNALSIPTGNLDEGDMLQYVNKKTSEADIVGWMKPNCFFDFSLWEETLTISDEEETKQILKVAEGKDIGSISLKYRPVGSTEDFEETVVTEADQYETQVTFLGGADMGSGSIILPAKYNFIAKYSADITILTEFLPYTGDPVSIEDVVVDNAGHDGECTITWLYSEDNPNFVPTEKGSYLIKAVFSETDIYVECSVVSVITIQEAYRISGSESETTVYAYVTDECVYNGKNQTPEIIIYDNATLLRKNIDYTITYRNNKNACLISENLREDNWINETCKGPYAIITGKGAYKNHPTFGDKGKIYIPFNIQPIEIYREELTVTYPTELAVKKENASQKLSIAIYSAKKKLQVNKDYCIHYEFEDGDDWTEVDSITLPGNYRFYAKGLGNYSSDTVYYYFVVNDANVLMNKAKVTGLKSIAYSDMEEYLYDYYDSQPGYHYKGQWYYLADKEAVQTLISSVQIKSDKYVTADSGYDEFCRKFTVYLPDLSYYELGKNSIIIVGNGANTTIETTDKNLKYYGIKEMKIDVKGIKLQSNFFELSKNSEVYTGEDIELKVVTTSKAGFVDEDYPHEYIYNKEIKYSICEAGTYTVVITGSGQYYGTVKKTFKVMPALLKEAKGATTSNISASFNDITFMRPATQAKGMVYYYPSGNLEDASVKLVQGVDYKVTYGNNKSVCDNAYATITGIGNYKGTVKKAATFKITQASLKNVKKVSKDQLTKKGLEAVINDMQLNKKKPNSIYKAGVTLYDHGVKVPTSEYSIEYKEVTGATADSAYVTAKLIIKSKTSGKKTPNYIDQSRELEYTIYSKKISSATITLVNPTQKYYYENKEAITPEIIVSITDKNAPGGKVDLVEGTDYEVSYSNNVKPGTAKITVTGIGAYNGTKTKTFVILPKWLYRFIDES